MKGIPGVSKRIASILEGILFLENGHDTYDLPSVYSSRRFNLVKRELTELAVSEVANRVTNSVVRNRASNASLSTTRSKRFSDKSVSS